MIALARRVCVFVCVCVCVSASRNRFSKRRFLLAACSAATGQLSKFLLF
jgi:hypothetical protein